MASIVPEAVGPVVGLHGAKIALVIYKRKKNVINVVLEKMKEVRYGRARLLC